MNVCSVVGIAIIFLLFDSGMALARTTVRVGVTYGPQAEIMEQLKQVAATREMDVHIVRYSQSGRINKDVSSGKLDAASFQEGISLRADTRSHRYELVPVAVTVNIPMGLYSKKVKRLKHLKPGATVAIPSSRKDAVRALRLMHTHDMIRLPGEFGENGSVRDIVKNPLRLRIIEVPPKKMTGLLDSADIVAMNYPEAAVLDLYPARDALAIEDSSTPYACVLTVRTSDKDKPWVTEIVRIYRSQQIKQFILERYQDSVRHPW